MFSNCVEGLDLSVTPFTLHGGEDVQLLYLGDLEFFESILKSVALRNTQAFGVLAEINPQDLPLPNHWMLVPRLMTIQLLLIR